MLEQLQAAKQLVRSVVADYDSTRRYRGKYHNEQIPMKRLPVDLVRKVGLQMLASIRLMQSLDAARVPLLPQIVSRLIRHAYGAEIHWKAAIEPGVSIVHGVGLVISHRARVEPGCILFQNVTLGEGIDPVTRISGAPHLARDVHVGPGATLIGPIHIGEGTKIMAGSVVTRSVPAGSIVRPADVTIAAREKRMNGA
jgi:serine O-acetyltransferase